MQNNINTATQEISDDDRVQLALDYINAVADIIDSHYPKRKKEVPKRRSTYKFMQYTLAEMHKDNN